MKISIPTVLLLFLYNCSTINYIQSKYFNCSQKYELKQKTDLQKLIYKTLKRAVVDEKDIADYYFIKDKRKIFISKTHYSKIWGMTKDEIVEFKFEGNEIPIKILNVKFCLKTEEELQEIADTTNDFMYLYFTNIEIKENIAKIGIGTSWKSKSNSKKVYLSGGGYILQFMKIKGIWKFDKVLTSWIS